MIPDFKVCSKCGQRLVLTMVTCGRCGNYMPHPPGMGPAIHERSQMTGMLALLCVLLCVALVFTLLNKVSSNSPAPGLNSRADNSFYTRKDSGLGGGMTP